MWIKVCGITDIPTAIKVIRQSPNALGLNFYEHTPRRVSVDVAVQIVRQLPSGIEPVGLFVNHPAGEVAQICTQCRIATIQLHGDETPAFLADLRDRMPTVRMIRVYRLGAEGLGPVAEDLDRCKAVHVVPYACLVDARVGGCYGGTGKTAPWGFLGPGQWKDDWPPLILAGGLHPGNVDRAIHTVRPWGVDVSSGVEASPAEKDAQLVQQFVDRARRAFDAVGKPKVQDTESNTY